jgi:putative oxidoreductase
MNTPSLLKFVYAKSQQLTRVAAGLQPIFLLVIRLYWGWQFFQTGLGKLMDIPKVSAFFESLGIVAPAFNAVLAGCSECFGGLLLLLGLGPRFVTIPLLTTMMVAYLTADLDKVKHIFADPDKFVTADPFLFLLAALIVFLFGSGPLSLDGILSRIRSGRHAESSPHSRQEVVHAA